MEFVVNRETVMLGVAGDGCAVRVYQPDLEEPFGRFIRRVWPPRAEGSGQSADRPANARAVPVLFVKDGEVIGHVGTVPVRLALPGGVRSAAWAVGLMVLPEYRNGLVAPLLMKKFNTAVDIGLTLHVEQPALRVFTGVGWRHLGVVPQYVRVLNARAFTAAFVRRGHRFLSPPWSRMWDAVTRSSGLAGAVVGATFGIASAAGWLRRSRPVGVSIVEEHGFDPAYAELAERVQAKLGVWVVRDAEYLASRYGGRMSAYRLIACRESGRLLGYCIVKSRQFRGDTRMRDIRMGTVVDCVFDPDMPRILDALLYATVSVCRRERLDVVFCSASLRQMRRHLTRHGFLPIPGTLHAAVYDRTGTIVEMPALHSWHLMRGDSDADANC